MSIGPNGVLEITKLSVADASIPSVCHMLQANEEEATKLALNLPQIMICYRRNMTGSSEWDNRMMDSLKNFDLSSPEVKEQFDHIRLTPEQVSKIMANPDVAMAFQNSRVQAAIMDCSQNPTSITKYQNDKEVMDIGAFPRGVWLTLSRNSF